MKALFARRGATRSPLSRAFVGFLAAVSVGTVGAVVVASPASAAVTCDSGTNYTFLKSDPLGKYATSQNTTNPRIMDNGTVQGWYQALYQCHDNVNWPTGWVSFKAAWNGKYLRVDGDAQHRLTATGLVPYPFNIGNLWTIGDCPNSPCIPVVSLTDLDSYLYVTAGNADGVVRANTNYVGWYQAWQIIN